MPAEELKTATRRDGALFVLERRALARGSGPTVAGAAAVVSKRGMMRHGPKADRVARDEAADSERARASPRTVAGTRPRAVSIAQSDLSAHERHPDGVAETSWVARQRIVEPIARDDEQRQVEDEPAWSDMHWLDDAREHADESGEEADDGGQDVADAMREERQQQGDEGESGRAARQCGMWAARRTQA